MAKLKKIKSSISEKKDWNAADAVQIIYAGANLLIACTHDYFKDQDSAFTEKYLKTVDWAFNYFERFNDKLKAFKKQEHIFNLAVKKYILILEEACQFNPNSLKFDRNNEREKQDRQYYEFLKKSIPIFEALISLLKPSEDWIKKYFKMVKIQIRSIMKIFEHEMMGV